ncbi:hypothetical protein J1614_009705 [Plenodomus biglobosus]|nr:hypothetical protein J1614_009705 [Plenodomus biglobosus]
MDATRGPRIWGMVVAGSWDGAETQGLQRSRTNPATPPASSQPAASQQPAKPNVCVALAAAEYY